MANSTAAGSRGPVGGVFRSIGNEVLAIGGDVRRFRIRRVRAIAGVCFSEAIRRRILWVIPLAVLGIIAVSQLTKSADEQDAIRQTIKYCLFASALLVLLATIILACTNLPREIESRVIYTIVSKPTSRLEIVIGKVAGFAAVSAAILLIMGVFTFGYLQVRQWSLLRDTRAALESGAADPVAAPTMQHSIKSGLLETKALVWPTDLEIFSRPPTADGLKWMGGGQQQFYAVDFRLTDADRAALEAAKAGGNLVAVIPTLRLMKHAPTLDERSELESGAYPLEHVASGLTAGPAAPASQPTTGPAAMPAPIPEVAIIINDVKGNSLGGDELTLTRQWPARPLADGASFEGPRTFVVPLSTKVVDNLLDASAFLLQVAAVTPSIEYGADGKSTSIVIFGPNAQPAYVISPVNIKQPGAPLSPHYYARLGRSGMQIRGRPKEEGDGSLAVYRFDNAEVGVGADGNVGLQVNLSIERGGDLDADLHQRGLASVQVLNRQTGELSPSVEFEPESARGTYVYLPAKSFQGGNFDVLIRGRTPGQWLGMHGLGATTPSIAVITAVQWFGLNLLKSLAVLWFLSVLAVSISIFCSTFLSWPIAVVLTTLLLFGGWGVEQLGDALAPGAARSVGGDIFGLRDPAKSAAVTSSLEALSSLLRGLGTVLPNVAHFPVIEDIERGVSVPTAKLWGALLTSLGYGVPLTALTYLILRNKEVAP